MTDGSHPYLSKISGILDSQLTLDSERNDRLKAISESTDASLNIQRDINENIASQKSSLDSMNSSLNNIESSLNGGDGIPSSSQISDADILPDGSIKSTLENLSSDLSSIQAQFTNAKNIVSGEFVPPSFSNGSCSTLTGPAGITVNPAQIGATLSPYAPIISILVYISIMFITFGSVFKFLSRGLK